MRLAHAALPLLVAAALPGLAAAAVTDVSAQGFRITETVDIAAPKDKVWKALIEPGRWWNPEHSWFGHPERDFRLDPRAGGCFCEVGPAGSVMHLTVVMVKPGDELHLWGALGPLQTEGAAGGMAFKLQPAGSGTRLTVTYTVGGYMTGGMPKWAPLVDFVLGEQVSRLERYAETGSPDAPKT
jgi:uncharacterized protein YndB with AHSA1/START domain